MLSPETILQNRYRIVRELGQGGMGAVYEAIDQRLDTTVAIKETLFTDERLRKQFEREARLLARLHHQALPRVSDHFNEGDGQFLVMQYVAGDDLFEMLTRRNGPFTQEEVLLWGDQLCEALDYLHTQDPQIIHRDIKPQNLKLTGRGQIILLDFGLAKGSGGQMSVVTTSASIFGYTPNYAPLEQVQGLGTDPRSDIYSLAATLYHLVTNVKPPDALSRAGAIVNGQPDPLPPANRVVPEVSAALSSVLNRGMAQKRNDRYPSAVAMRAALRTAAESPHLFSEADTVLATDPLGASDTQTAASEKQTRLAREPDTVAAGSEARTLLATDTATVHAVAAGSPGETVTVVQKSKRASGPWLAAGLVIVLVTGVAAAFYAMKVRPRAAAVDQPSTPQSAPQNVPAAVASDSPAPAVANPAPPTNVKTAESRPKAVTETASQRATSAKQPEKKPEPAKPTNGETASHEGADRLRNPPPGFPGPGFPPPGGPGRYGDPGRQPLPPRVRTFPNGVQVVTQPDGTRIVTMRNGTTRVIPPDQKPNRKRNPPPK